MDLDAVLAELDDEQAAAIRGALADKDAAKAKMERDLKLATDSEIRQKYPRAWKAYEKKMIDFGDAVSPEDISKILKGKEEELAALGVPVDTPAPAAVQEAEPDPAAAFGAPVGGGQQTAPRDLTKEYLETMKVDSYSDRAKLPEIIAEMNKKGASEEINRLSELLSAQPIRSKHGLI